MHVYTHTCVYFNTPSRYCVLISLFFVLYTRIYTNKHMRIYVIYIIYIYTLYFYLYIYMHRICMYIHDIHFICISRYWVFVLVYMLYILYVYIYMHYIFTYIHDTHCICTSRYWVLMSLVLPPVTARINSADSPVTDVPKHTQRNLFQILFFWFISMKADLVYNFKVVLDPNGMLLLVPNHWKIVNTIKIPLI